MVGIVVVVVVMALICWSGLWVTVDVVVVVGMVDVVRLSRKLW